MTHSLSIAALILAFTQPLFAADAPKPNIVLIFIDDKYEVSVEDASNPARTADFIANSASFKFTATQ
jgi:hypothetical protein